MANALTRLLIIGILEALYQVTVTRVLTMRSRFAYHAIKTADFFITMSLRNLDMFPTPAMIGAIVLFDFALPVMLSSGSYSRRILRATFVEFDSVIGDLLGTTLFVTVFGGSTADLQQLGQGMTPKAATVYLLVALISALLFELTIAVCNHSDKTNDQISSLPTILLIPSAVVLFIVTYVRFVGDGMRHIPSYVCAWISLGGVYLIVYIARREAASQREAADAALAARKARHALAEVQAMSWRARGLAALRHALTNDVREIPRLAGSGQTDEAARELSGLLEQARILNGEKR